MPSRILLTPKDVAELTGLAISTLAKIRCAGGGIPFCKLGSRVRYVASDVEAWLDAQPVHHSTSSYSNRTKHPGRSRSTPVDRTSVAS